MAEITLKTDFEKFRTPYFSGGAKIHPCLAAGTPYFWEFPTTWCLENQYHEVQDQY